MAITRNSIAALILLGLLGVVENTALGQGRLRRARRAGGERESLTHGGITRTYVVRTPRQVGRQGTPLPVVLVLHGGGGNAANAENMTGFTKKGQQEGFLVVYPEGISRMEGRLLTWNAGHCCGYAMKQKVDDVGFILALLDKLQADYSIDPNRIYVTGMSNGAMMSHRLGMELSRRVAAIAPVVGALFGDEKNPPNGVSAIMINGALDQSVPSQGGPTGGRSADAWDGTPTKPSLEQGRFWAAANGCDATPQEQSQASFTQWKYKCPSGKAVELYLVKDNGHAWPGGEKGSARGDEPSKSMNATDMIWDFFKAHPLSR